MDGLFTVGCATSYDSFGSVGIETCYIAVGCLGEFVADRRHFGRMIQVELALYRKMEEKVS